jgi:deoxyadenosine/deoxycytidine kinase
VRNTIVIEGTVGCGKTTLAKFLAEKSKIKMYEELSNNDTIVLLDDFYANQKRWSFALQIHFLNERFRMIKEINKNTKGILDRSIYGDKIFAKMLHEDDKMTVEEYNTYTTLLNNMLEHVNPPDLIVYLKCSTDVAVDRLNKRNRGIESDVPISYWQRLNNKYDEWYDNYNMSDKMSINVDEFNVFNINQRENILNEILVK